MSASLTTSRIRAFSTLGCVDLPLGEIFDLARHHRLDAIELRGFDGTLDLPARFEYLFSSPRACAAALGMDDALRICAMDTSFKLAEATDADRAQLLRFVPWAEALGVPRLRVFDGVGLPGEPALARALATLDWWRTLRAENGWRVDLMVETHSSLQTTPAILRFLDCAPADTALLWDCHHTWRIGGEHPADTWRAIRARVVHIHVKDSVTTPTGPRPYAYALCGAGEFPMGALLAALAEDAWTGVISLEWERKWHPELPPLAHALSSASAHRWW